MQDAPMFTRKLKQAAYFATGVVALRADDVLLSSFPRSGNTWVRFLLCNLISLNEWNGREVDFALLNQAMPEIGANNLFAPWPWRTIPRLVKTHKPYLPFFRGKRAIGLIRDPRDVMISYFHYTRDRKQLFTGTFSDFIRSKEFGLPLWFAHYASWREHWTVTIRYEDMKEDPLRELQRILKTLDVSFPTAVLEEAIGRASAQRIRKLDGKAASNDRTACFVRNTRLNQWVDYFDDSDLAYYRQLTLQYNNQQYV